MLKGAKTRLRGGGGLKRLSGKKIWGVWGSQRELPLVGHGERRLSTVSFPVENFSHARNAGSM